VRPVRWSSRAEGLQQGDPEAGLFGAGDLDRHGLALQVTECLAGKVRGDHPWSPPEVVEPDRLR
jgi:hypothetical protein